MSQIWTVQTLNDRQISCESSQVMTKALFYREDKFSNIGDFCKKKKKVEIFKAIGIAGAMINRVKFSLNVRLLKLNNIHGSGTD